MVRRFPRALRLGRFTVVNGIAHHREISRSHVTIQYPVIATIMSIELVTNPREPEIAVIFIPVEYHCPFSDVHSIIRRSSLK